MKGRAWAVVEHDEATIDGIDHQVIARTARGTTIFVPSASPTT